MIDEALLEDAFAELADEIPVPPGGDERVVNELVEHLATGSARPRPFHETAPRGGGDRRRGRPRGAAAAQHVVEQQVDRGRTAEQQLGRHR